MAQATTVAGNSPAEFIRRKTQISAPCLQAGRERRHDNGTTQHVEDSLGSEDP